MPRQGSNSGSRKMKTDDSYSVYRVMKEMGWTLEELKQCPIPTFYLIVKWINKEDEHQSNMK